MRTCPRCGIKRMTKYPALSRVDNKTGICSQCGVDEALTAFVGFGVAPKQIWASNLPAFDAGEANTSD